MRMKQVSVFVENRPGRLEVVLEALARAEVNIRALSIADTADFGIVRMILSDTEKGLEAIRGAGFAASTNDVLRVEIPGPPGRPPGDRNQAAGKGRHQPGVRVRVCRARRRSTRWWC